MIPKIIHQMWVGPEPFPEHCREHCAEWRRLHPGWDYRMHGDEILARYPQVAHLTGHLNAWSKVSDVLRYHLLHDVGGLYADVDCWPVRTFDHLLEYPAVVVGSWGQGREVQAGLLLSEPGHTFLGNAVAALRSARASDLNGANANWATGPGFLHKFLHRDLLRLPPDACVLTSDSYATRYRVKPFTLARHHCLGTWQKSK